MKQIPTLMGLQIVPEHWIMEIAKMSENDPTSTMHFLVDSAQDFRNAGLTPVFLADDNLGKVCVTTREKLQKKFH
jgi:hypothetical protein